MHVLRRRTLERPHDAANHDAITHAIPSADAPNAPHNNKRRIGSGDPCGTGGDAIDGRSKTDAPAVGAKTDELSAA